jgi:hypothetical protein
VTATHRSILAAAARAAVVQAALLVVIGCGTGGLGGAGGGAAGARPFSGDLALDWVRRTPAYRQVTSDIADHVRHEVDATADGHATVAVYEDDPAAKALIATFRVLPDGRVYIWNWAHDDWQVVGTFR